MRGRPVPPAVVNALLEELEASGNVAEMAKHLGVDPARVLQRLRKQIENAPAPVAAQSLQEAFPPARARQKPKAGLGRALSDGQARTLAAIAILDKDGEGVASGAVAHMMDKAGHPLGVEPKFVSSRIQGFFSGLEKRGFVRWPAKAGFLRKAFITDQGRNYLGENYQGLHVQYAAVAAGMENDDGGASKFF